MKINMVDCVLLIQGGVSANTAVSVNSRGCGLWCHILQILQMDCSETLLMIYGD